jgi:hypothetical protein
VLGRSEAALGSYLEHLEGKERVRLMCLDLSSSYRAFACKHFPMPALWLIGSMSCASSTGTSLLAGVNSTLSAHAIVG